MPDTALQRQAVSDRDASRAKDSLFRSEVLAEQQTQWLGTVLLAPRISYVLLTAFSVLAAAAILGLLFFGELSRKARISGWLVPQQGIVRIFAPSSGVVTQLYVHEGADVEKGAPLMTLSTELQSEAFGATREVIASRLASRRGSLVAEKKLLDRVYTQQRQEFSSRLTALRSEQEHLEQELDLYRARLELARASEERQRQLHRGGVVPLPQLQKAEEERLDQALKLRALLRHQAATEQERLALEGQLGALPLKHEAQLAEIDRAIATLEQELAEAEAKRQIVIPAPQEGTVTAIQVDLGGSVDTSVPLLSIVPAGSYLEARLFSPSRAIGFVRPGQRVLLRYQAFPYQKFGHYEGAVVNVSRSAVSPGELPPQLSVMTSLYGANEPIYRITVSLASQSVIAYGEAVQLQPGMQLEADVLIERRRLIEWVLDPLFTLTGRWQG